MVLYGPFGPLAGVYAAQQAKSAPPVQTPPPAAGGDITKELFGPGKNVLLVGDSHTAGFQFGTTLKEKIKNTGSNLTVEAKSGKSPPYFTAREGDGTSKLQKSIAKSKPDTIVIALGTNFKSDITEMGQGSANAYVKMMADQIKKDAPDAKVVWVGRPVNLDDKPADLEKFDKTMKAACEKYGIRYIRSSDITTCTPEPGRDPKLGPICKGEHIVDNKAGAQWATDVFQRITHK